MKVVVYAICKNEEKFAQRFLNSLSLADEIIILDTGSTDSTVDILKKGGAKVYTRIISPWRFDVARNCVLDLLPNDADVCISMDLDEVIEQNWRQKLEKCYDKDVKQYYYTYVWSHVDGKDGYTFFGDKIHARSGFVWVNAVHEVLKFVGNDYKCAYTDIRIDHYPDENKSRSQYLNLLELSVNEDPDNDRNMHYLGREYFFTRQYEKAITTLKAHLKMKTATWKRERSASMGYIAQSYEALSDYKNAEKWYFYSIIESPDTREPYLHAAKFYFLQKDYLASLLMCQKALNINTKCADYITEPESFNGFLYDVASICCYHLGLMKKALYYVNIALAFSPEDKRLLDNKNLIINNF